MLVRTTKGRTHPGQVDEFVRRCPAIAAAHVPRISGLHSVYRCGDRDADTVIAIHLWDRSPDQAGRELHERQRFRDQVLDLLRA